MLSRLRTLLTASLRQAFAADFPEIFEVACCFVTLFRSYTDGQELTLTLTLTLALTLTLT